MTATLITCRRCHEGTMQPFEQVERFHPPGGEVEVRLLASRCTHCGREMVLPSQMQENIARREARRAKYGSHLLGEDIFAFRRKYGLTQQAASKIFGKGKIAFSRYETESSFPDESTTKLLKMAMRFPNVLQELAKEAGVVIPLWSERVADEQKTKVFAIKPVQVNAQQDMVVAGEAFEAAAVRVSTKKASRVQQLIELEEESEFAFEQVELKEAVA